DSWAAANLPGLSAALTAPTADPDGDGQLNLLEFAFDTNPLATNASPFAISRAVDGSLWLSYPKRTGFSGLRYTVLKSDDLITWASVADGDLEETTQSVPGRPLELVTARIVNVVAGAFFRLEV